MLIFWHYLNKIIQYFFKCIVDNDIFRSALPEKQTLTKHQKIVRDALNKSCHLHVLTHIANYMLI